MSPLNIKQTFSVSRLLPAVMGAATMLLAAVAHAAAPGITGSTFSLTAQPAFISQPDGSSIYSWGYGCSSPPPSTGYAPAGITGACSTMQVPGPTLIVTAPVTGTATVTVTLANGLPGAAGNTSILFPGFQVTTSGGVAGLMTQEAAPGGSVTYTITIPSTAAGTHSYYSGTQGDLQIEMGLYGALIVLPSTVPAACTTDVHANNQAAQSHWGESDFRLAAAAY